MFYIQHIVLIPDIHLWYYIKNLGLYDQLNDKKEAISEQNSLVLQEQLKAMLLRLWCDCRMLVSARVGNV